MKNAPYTTVEGILAEGTTPERYVFLNFIKFCFVCYFVVYLHIRSVFVLFRFSQSSLIIQKMGVNLGARKPFLKCP